MSFTLREAGPEDLARFSELRAKMFATFYTTDGEALAAADQEFFSAAMARGEAGVWLAEDADGHAVACCAVTLYHLPPKPFALSGVRAYLSSMWTEPYCRKQGLASRMISLAKDFAARAGASHLALHATEAGRALYTELGFDPTNEMVLSFPVQPCPSSEAKS